MIRVAQLRKTFGPVLAVDDVSFAVEPGSVLGFLGPNGAGKSTTLRILAGFLAPTSGSVQVAGIDLADPHTDFRARLGYLPESAPSYAEMRVDAYLRYVASLHRAPRSAVAEIIARVGLEPMARRRVATLSKGYRQRVGLAAALVHDPPVVVLDEPTSGLDPNQIVEIRQVIKALGQTKTVVFSSHRLAEVEAIADRVLVLNHGRVVADAPLAELRRAPGTRVVVELGTRDAEAVRVTLAALPVSVAIEVTEAGLRLELTSERDVRAEVARALSARWPLLQMTAPSDDLADVFRDLTSAP